MSNSPYQTAIAGYTSWEHGEIPFTDSFVVSDAENSMLKSINTRFPHSTSDSDNAECVMEFVTKLPESGQSDFHIEFANDAVADALGDCTFRLNFKKGSFAHAYAMALKSAANYLSKKDISHLTVSAEESWGVAVSDDVSLVWEVNDSSTESLLTLTIKVEDGHGWSISADREVGEITVLDEPLEIDFTANHEDSYSQFILFLKKFA